MGYKGGMEYKQGRNYDSSVSNCINRHGLYGVHLSCNNNSNHKRNIVTNRFNNSLICL